MILFFFFQKFKKKKIQKKKQRYFVFVFIQGVRGFIYSEKLREGLFVGIAGKT